MDNRQSRGSLLYVDDEEGNLLAFVASFRKYYDHIYTVKTPQEGMDILHNHHVDVVLTDQRMPGITGVQFLEMIIPEFPDTIRMIVTGYSDIQDVINAINTGRIFRYIQKPWDINELKLSIDQALKTRALEVSNRELVDVLQKEVAGKNQILKIFQKYVPANVVNELIPEAISNEHQKAALSIMTVLYSNIKVFNKIVAKKNPTETVQYLNNYFALMGECIEKYHGSINKFIGSGMLVTFRDEAAPKNAISCALEMISLLDEINSQNGQKIEIGIGINTGEIIIGNIGTALQKDYTAIGDTVDVTQVIQEFSYDIPNGVFITQTTHDEIKQQFECELLGPKTIRGRDETVNIYRVIKPLMPN